MFINASEATFEEFKQLLKDNDIDIKDNIIRINLAGMGGCCGPSFNILVDEKKDDDLICETNDIKFIINQDLYDKFGDFLIEGTSENNKGLILKPVDISSSSGCGGCGGGCS